MEIWILSAQIWHLDETNIKYRLRQINGDTATESSNVMTSLPLHTFKDFRMVKSPMDAFSPSDPAGVQGAAPSWDNLIIVNEFFKKFGLVNVAIILCRAGHRTQRNVVSFKESSMAQGIVGTRQKILYCTTVVKAVSAVNQKKMCIWM